MLAMRAFEHTILSQPATSQKIRITAIIHAYLIKNIGHSSAIHQSSSFSSDDIQLRLFDSVMGEWGSAGV